jgi:DMSO/TMAO reductase YedYZ heme-binding membrane subunit
MLFVLALMPLAFLVYRALNNGLGANPIETINRYTGDWVLRFLLVTLAVTPLRRLFGWNALLRYRRMLGLFAFFYAAFPVHAWLVSISSSRTLSRMLPSITSPSVCLSTDADTARCHLHECDDPAPGCTALAAHRRLVYRQRGRRIFVAGEIRSARPMIYGAILAALLIQAVARVRRDPYRRRQER